MYLKDSGEMHKPTMSYETALDQAANTPWVYMDKAEEAIDAKFGHGYAKKNPQLVSQMMGIMDNTCGRNGGNIAEYR